MFHAYLGYLALAGGAVLVVIAIANQYLWRGAQARAAIAGQQAGGMADQIRTEAEMVQAMGMR